MRVLFIGALRSGGDDIPGAAADREETWRPAGVKSEADGRWWASGPRAYCSVAERRATLSIHRFTGVRRLHCSRVSSVEFAR